MWARAPEAVTWLHFLIVEIKNVRDQATYARDRGEISEKVAAAGGEYLVRGGRVESWKETGSPASAFRLSPGCTRLVMGSQYAELKAKRQGSTDTNMILVEGVSDE